MGEGSGWGKVLKLLKLIIHIYEIVKNNKKFKYSLLLRKWWFSSAPQITLKKLLVEESNSTYRVKTWNYFIIQLKASHLDEDPVRKLQDPPAETSVGKVVFICTPTRTKVKTGMKGYILCMFKSI